MSRSQIVCFGIGLIFSLGSGMALAKERPADFLINLCAAVTCLWAALSS